MNLAYETWFSVQWDNMGNFLLSAPLEMAPVSGVGLSHLEMSHTAQVRLAPLELAGGGTGCCSLGCFIIIFCTIID